MQFLSYISLNSHMWTAVIMLDSQIAVTAETLCPLLQMLCPSWPIVTMACNSLGYEKAGLNLK